jgi:hypothetical protein
LFCVLVRLRGRATLRIRLPGCIAPLVVKCGSPNKSGPALWGACQVVGKEGLLEVVQVTLIVLKDAP